MSFWKIAWRNMQQRALASSLTGLSMALGVALMILVIVVYGVVVDQLENDAQGYNLIVGGKGGSLQLVLNTVFHLDKPLYPIPYSYYKRFIDGDLAPYTEVAIPYCLGDSFVGGGQIFRVVATTPDLFERLPYGANDDGTEQKYEFAEGRNFKTENFFEAVVGSRVARKCGLKVGDLFEPTHGLGSQGDKHRQFKIVGVLERTGTANDRALFANMEGFYLLEGHALTPEPVEGQPTPPTIPPPDEDGNPQPLPEAQREVTSILVRCKDSFGAQILDTQINKGKDRIAQAVAPRYQVQRLQDSFVKPVQMVLMVLTVLIVVVAGISILVSIYNSMAERAHDIAVMRALGASRNAVMAIVLVESILLSLLGGLAGVLIGHTVLAIAAPAVEEHAGVAVSFWDFNWQEALLVPGLVAFASLVGFMPAMTAYRTDVGRALGGGR